MRVALYQQAGSLARCCWCAPVQSCDQVLLSCLCSLCTTGLVTAQSGLTVASGLTSVGALTASSTITATGTWRT
jgi:hypothetical protein